MSFNDVMDQELDVVFADIRKALRISLDKVVYDRIDVNLPNTRHEDT